MISLGCAIYFYIRGYKNKKTENIKDDAFNQSLKQSEAKRKLDEKLPEIISSVESMIGAGHGDIKQAIALSRILVECIQAGLTYDEQEYIGKIENILKTPQAHNNQE